MLYEYVYYTTDDSFDYGDFPGATCYQTGYHGFDIEIDKDNNIDLSTLKGCGDFAAEVEEIKNIEDFKSFLAKNKPYIQEWNDDSVWTNEELFNELEIITNYNIIGKKVA